MLAKLRYVDIPSIVILVFAIGAPLIAGLF